MLTEMIGNGLSTEIYSYLSVIEDASIRERLEEEIARFIASRHLNEEGNYYRIIDIRQKCLGAMLSSLSKRDIRSPPGRISDRMCKFAVELYIRNGYKKFDNAEQSLIIGINNFNDNLARALENYLFSERCNRYAFYGNVKYSGKFAKRINSFRKIYPEMSLEKIINYIFMLKPSSGTADRKNRLLVETVVLIKDNGYDFFDIMDELRNHYQPLGKDIYAKDFNMFGYNLARLTNYNKRLEDYFSKDFPCSMERLSNLICALSNSYNPNPKTLALSSDYFNECIAWANLGHSISEYVKDGYCLWQLRIIRSILSHNVDPMYFDINPGMSPEQMKKAIDIESLAIIEQIRVDSSSLKHRAREVS